MSADPQNQNPPQQVEIVEQDSDAELEAALPELEADDDEFNTAPVMAGSSLPPRFSGAPFATGFKLPPNPAIPQDLSLIAEMVSSHQVVGALPPLSISAAEKRRLVEASMRSGKDKGKGRELEAEVLPPTNAKQDLAGEEESDSDSDSDSSSEFLSDVDGGEADKPVQDKPMTATEHAEIKANLDRLVQASRSADVEESDSSSEEEDEGEGEGVAEFEFSSSPIPSPRGPTIPLDMLDDDEDLATGDPILSIHEVPLPPVPQPPVGKLPSGEAMSLAGDVVSWMKEKKVETWVEKEQSKAQVQAEAVEESQSGGGLEDASTQGLDVSKGNDTEVEEGDGMALDGDLSGSKPLTTINQEQVPQPPQESTAETSKAPLPSESSSVPRFNSAGTVVVRAMQERPGQEGWLEEGSVLCWSDGRVLGTVSDTFGPLTSPFYSIRLPPPPHPYPTHFDLSPGTRLFYPSNPVYRSFVNMQAVRDPRFKGSDASNIYDEEIGEDEIEWSDDEAEAEAKRRRKAKRGGSALPRGGGRGGARGWGGSDAGGSTPRATQHPSLPQRPHFDFQPDDASDAGDAGSMYGDVPGPGDGDTWSEAGSTASGRGRPKPAPYELDDDMGAGGGGGGGGGDVSGLGGGYAGVSGGRGRGGGGGGGGGGGVARGQGRNRGRGRGGAGQGGRGGHDRRPSGGPGQRGTGFGGSGGFCGPGPSSGLPPRPQPQPQPQGQGFGQAPLTPHGFQGGPQQYPQQQQHPQHQQQMGGYDPSNPIPLHSHQSNPPQFPNPGMQFGQIQPQLGYSPNPSQPGQGQMQRNGPHPASAAQGHGQWTTHFPGFPQGQGLGPFPGRTDFGFQQTHQQQQQQQQQPPMSMPGAPNQGAVANAPAINPRFAAQYQQMFQGGYGWPGQQGPGNNYSE